VFLYWKIFQSKNIFQAKFPSLALLRPRPFTAILIVLISLMTHVYIFFEDGKKFLFVF
jgi:hypothetical protein